MQQTTFRCVASVAYDVCCSAGKVKEGIQSWACQLCVRDLVKVSIFYINFLFKFMTLVHILPF